jgi:hypothetical protein
LKSINHTVEKTLTINHIFTHIQLNNHHVLISGALPQNPSIAVHSVNLATMKHVTENFSESNIIGQGGFGVVYKVSSSFTDTLKTPPTYVDSIPPVDFHPCFRRHT